MEPQRQSALQRCHLNAGAQLELLHGWLTPLRYAEEPSLELARVRSGAGISDASYLTKLDLRGHTSDSPEDLPLALPARVWKLTPRHALITSPNPIAFAPSTSVTDITSVYSAILLAGPRSRQVLQKLTTLNVRAEMLAEGTARQSRLAHVNATVLRVTDHAGVPAFLILNTRDAAEHVWESLLYTGAAYDIRPFGSAAQQAWLGAA